MFHVYENWTHKRGRAHAGDCSYCDHGRGTQASHSGRNDQWHGPLSSRADADRVLARLKRKGWTDVKWCAACGGEA